MDKLANYAVYSDMRSSIFYPLWKSFMTALGTLQRYTGACQQLPESLMPLAFTNGFVVFKEMFWADIGMNAENKRLQSFFPKSESEKSYCIYPKARQTALSLWYIT